jgi:hypothetical protein
MTKPIDNSIAQEAMDIVSGARQQTYGHPSKNFEDTARLWSVVLGIEVTPQQVALCMVQLKLAREVFSPKRDNLVDAIGYLLAYDATGKEANEKSTIRISTNNAVSYSEYTNRDR